MRFSVVPHRIVVLKVLRVFASYEDFLPIYVCVIKHLLMQNHVNIFFLCCVIKHILMQNHVIFDTQTARYSTALLLFTCFLKPCKSKRQEGLVTCRSMHVHKSRNSTHTSFLIYFYEFFFFSKRGKNRSSFCI
jgi:hypothetical protein